MIVLLTDLSCGLWLDDGDDCTPTSDRDTDNDSEEKARAGRLTSKLISVSSITESIKRNYRCADAAATTDVVAVISLVEG